MCPAEQGSEDHNMSVFMEQPVAVAMLASCSLNEQSRPLNARHTASASLWLKKVSSFEPETTQSPLASFGENPQTFGNAGF